MAKNDRKKQIYLYIKQRCQQGIPPTIREICDALEIPSTSTVHKCVKLLAEEGYIEKDDKLTRTLKLPGASAIQVPIIQKYVDLDSLSDPKNIEGYIPVSIPGAETLPLFAVKMTDDNLAQAGIFTEDFVVFEQTDDLPNGAIAAVLVDDSLMVRRFVKEESIYRLESMDGKTAPYLTDHCVAVGVIRACIRMYR